MGQIIVTMARNSKGHIFGGTWGGGKFEYGIYKCTDNGENWFPSGLKGLEINSIFINNKGDIFAGTNYGSNGIYRSTDDGNSWVEVNNGLPVKYTQYVNIIKDKQGNI